MNNNPGLRQLSDDVRSGKTTLAELVSTCLARADESRSVFISIDHQILETAEELDVAIKAGENIPALAGLPITLKDLFDVKGELTKAGSIALRHQAKPAVRDCDVVSTLRNAGLLFLGRTNMSEFAFSGMGMNPHYGTPPSIWDRATGRLPGGSSSGSAVSVAEGIVPATMGSDTAGSCRIPAAFNGIVGVKPSYGRYSLKGVYPLSPTSDAPGPLGVDVDSCFILDQIITANYDGNDPLPELKPMTPKSMKLMVPQSIVMDDLDPEVALAFNKGIEKLEQAGVEIINQPAQVLDDCVEMFLSGPVVGYEAWQHHKELIEKWGEEYDPFVYKRLANSKAVSYEEQQRRYQRKADLGAAFDQMIKATPMDALIYPTVQCIPPSISETKVAENAARINLRCLRNTSTVNYFDGCAISLPCNQHGQAPVGMMISSAMNQDDHLYRVAAALEKILAP